MFLDGAVARETLSSFPEISSLTPPNPQTALPQISLTIVMLLESNVLDEEYLGRLWALAVEGNVIECSISESSRFGLSAEVAALC
ncbi:hypothetical protein MIND_00905400 [Mycena indigotica]|uniref:Uncharacterized protein n=1 Tax=Mycena indigotica TaxID=2126181 RepID=A0A8H6W065_9AGAR|nr:uncharacterized protein MIND_00905400 [Mycena indigotica]KAF7296748.1 hypothetical protein MIND_00905400 [Mycena indigotica]